MAAEQKKPEKKYSPFDDDLPKVQISLGRRKAGLAIDGEFYTLFELPEDAKDAYIRYYDHDVKVYQCGECGFLTQSDRIGDYNGYTCSNCGRNSSRYTNFKPVYGDHVHEDNFVDVPNLDPDDVPNSKGHLTQIQNEVEKGITRDEMMYRVAKAVKEFREA